MAWKSSFRQNYRTTFSPTVPTSAAGISHVVADVEAPGGEKWEHLKGGGKQWQATPKNLPKMQRTRAIPVAWLNSGLCPGRPKGWIPIIIIIIIIIILGENFVLIYEYWNDRFKTAAISVEQFGFWKLGNKFLVCYETWRLITVLTRGHHRFLLSARWLLSIPTSCFFKIK